MANKKSINRISNYVAQYYQEHKQPGLVFHNLDHTIYVVKALAKIADYHDIPADDGFLLLAAGWFHNLGYVHGINGYAENSLRVARAYMEEQGLAESQMVKVLELITIAHQNVEPSNLLQEIILDAVNFHVGKKSFLKKNELLRKETELTEKKIVSRNEWYKNSTEFLENHRFHTVYAKTLLAEQKSENLYHLKALAMQYATNAALTPANLQSKNTERAEKAIDTAFRIASQNNQRLSSLADNKAHILITVNSIILSAIISLVLRKLEENSYLALPTFILLAVSLTSMVLAIITTRPTVSKGTFSRGDIAQRKTNLLFFGNYYKMLPEQFTSGMWMMLNDKINIYHSIMLDIYYQGNVLGRKYHYLRFAYNIFMCGLVTAVLAFFLAAVLHHDQRANPNATEKADVTREQNIGH